ncbi:MAG: hypothetical protein HFJ45_03265 [Clostridia bacterium]|nr:hypothetical protein [Clostridia bacterium]
MPIKFINTLFIIIIFLVFVCTINLKNNINLTSESKEFLNSTFHYNSNSNFFWPIFGYYTISSAFGNRISPTTRCIYLPFWYRYTSS